MKFKNLFFIGIIFTLVSCGNSIKVLSDYQSGTDFNKYRSFSIVEVDAAETGIGEINLRRIIVAVNNQMTVKGMKEMDNADLEVHIHGLVKDKVSTDVSTDYYGGGYYRRPFGWGTSSTSVDISEYKEGTLIIDLVDAGSKKLVWQGMGTAKVNEDPKGREDRINKAVAKILAEFPPQG